MVFLGDLYDPKNELYDFAEDDFDEDQMLNKKKDAARIIEESLSSKNQGVYNLHLENIKILDLAEKIKKNFEDVSIEKIDIKFQDARNYQADGKKLRKDGVSEIKKLILENRITNINDPRYTNQKYLELFKSKLEF